MDVPLLKGTGLAVRPERDARAVSDRLRSTLHARACRRVLQLDPSKARRRRGPRGLEGREDPLLLQPAIAAHGGQASALCAQAQPALPEDLPARGSARHGRELPVERGGMAGRRAHPAGALRGGHQAVLLFLMMEDCQRAFARTRGPGLGKQHPEGDDADSQATTGSCLQGAPPHASGQCQTRTGWAGRAGQVHPRKVGFSGISGRWV